MIKMVEIECPSGKFLLVENFRKEKDIAVDTTVHLLDKPTLEDWFKKGDITEEDRLFCIADELLVEAEEIKHFRLIQRGKTLLEVAV
jgi:hypothetical protein